MKVYDYIIIGAGSAGCVLANRLSAFSNNNIAVFEAGPSSDTWKVDMPSAILYTMHDPKINWKYFSEPEPYINNRRIFCPRGKMIGGCSSHNGMVYVRGHPQDFNRWAQQGLNKWSYNHVLPYFKKLESWSGGENEFRGGKGPLNVTKSKINEKFPLYQAVINAAKEAGYGYTDDSNGFKQEGFCTYDLTIKDGKRCGTGKAYMKDALKRDNVKVFTNSEVLKIIIEDNEAKGIEIQQDGKKEKIFAGKEVILSCGSINSPKLLLLSGIGEAQSLKELGIEVKHDLPGVGKNLQDHIEVYVAHECKKPVTLHGLFNNPITKVYQGLQWFMFKKGLLSHSHLEVGGFVRSSEEYEHPNIQFHFFPSLVMDHGLKSYHKHSFQFHASPNRPTSRGWVKLRSSNPKDSPKIQFNYLETESDRKQMRDCAKIARKIFSENAMKEYLGKEILPGENVKNDEELDEVIKNTCETAYHPSCSNKMGIDKMSVVDQETKVIGIKNLRVVDSSIMPDIVSGNLNAATIMIAEKASDIILGKSEEPFLEKEFYKVA